MKIISNTGDFLNLLSSRWFTDDLLTSRSYLKCNFWDFYRKTKRQFNVKDTTKVNKLIEVGDMFWEIKQEYELDQNTLWLSKSYGISYVKKVNLGYPYIITLEDLGFYRRKRPIKDRIPHLLKLYS